jgi:archaemetzincin
MLLKQWGIEDEDLDQPTWSIANECDDPEALALVASWKQQRRRRVALCALLAMLGISLWSAAKQRSPAEYEPAAQIVPIPTTLQIDLQPFGRIPDIILTRHVRLLEQRFQAKVVVLDAIPLPAKSYHAERGQYHAIELLNLLFERREPRPDQAHEPPLQLPSAQVTVGVLAEDLYAEGWEYLYGLSQADGQVAIYSLARTLAPMTFSLGGIEKGLQHADKVMLHELGHALHLGHCTHPNCVMNTDDRAPDLHQLGRFYCQRCQRRVLNPENYQELDGFARADGLYRRGSFDRAMVHYLAKTLQNPFDAAAANRLGVSLAAKRHPLLARTAYRLALAREPQLAVAYYNLGLLYAPVDPTQSLAYLREGYLRDPQRVEALGFLGTVFLRVYKDEARALAFFERYVRAGGQSPAVLHQYRSMVYPVFDFAEAEVDVIRGERGACGMACQVQKLRWTLECVQLAGAVGDGFN